MKIVGICGSLREKSYNKALLKYAVEHAPEGVEIETVDISTFPLYNDDNLGSMPEMIKIFKQKLKEADAVLFSSPEYNYSIPGGLKNAIDWASRPYTDNSLDDKPVAVMGASIGQLGTGRMQYHLRQSLVLLNVHFVNRPEVMVAFAADKFDEAGEITDEKTKEKVLELVTALVAWTKRLQK